MLIAYDTQQALAPILSKVRFAHWYPSRYDSLIQALGSGSVITAIGKLKEVYYVLELGSNLFSVSKATDTYAEFVIDRESLIMQKLGCQSYQSPESWRHLSLQPKDRDAD